MRQNIKQLKTYRDITDEAIAKAGGYLNRQVVNFRVTGRAQMTTEDIDRFAAALRVEPYVLMWDTADVLRWVEQNPTFRPRVKLPKQKPGRTGAGRKPARKAKK